MTLKFCRPCCGILIPLALILMLILMLAFLYLLLKSIVLNRPLLGENIMMGSEL